MPMLRGIRLSFEKLKGLIEGVVREYFFWGNIGISDWENLHAASKRLVIDQPAACVPS